MGTQNPNKSNVLNSTNLVVANRILSRLRQKYSWLGLDELRSYAYLGLVLAAESFDPNRGVDFDQYASIKGTYLAVDEMRRDGVVSRGGATPKHSTTSAFEEGIHDLRAGEGQREVELRDLCKWLLDRLRPDDRRLVLMYYSDGLTFREIGQVLGISESAACLRHQAVLRKLRSVGGKLGIRLSAIPDPRRTSECEPYEQS